MIPPFLPQILPGQPGQGRGTNQAGQEATPDFATWMQQHPAAPPPVAEGDEAAVPPLRESTGRAPLEQLQSVEAPHLPTLEELKLRAAEAWNHSRPVHEHAHPHAPHAHEHVHEHAYEHSLAPRPHAHAPELPPASPGEWRPQIRLDPKFGAHGERVDQIEIPWRLQANAGLSYIGAGRVMQALVARAAQASGAHAVPGQSGAAGVASPETARFTVLSREASAARSQAEITASTREIQAGAAAAEPERLQARLGPLLSWPHRMLRWLEDREGATAWVRDYRADATSMASLVDSLRCMAAEQGLPLRRVMLNGRELWRSANPST